MDFLDLLMDFPNAYSRNLHLPVKVFIHFFLWKTFYPLILNFPATFAMIGSIYVSNMVSVLWIITNSALVFYSCFIYPLEILHYLHLDFTRTLLQVHRKNLIYANWCLCLDKYMIVCMVYARLAIFYFSGKMLNFLLWNFTGTFAIVGSIYLSKIASFPCIILCIFACIVSEFLAIFQPFSINILLFAF